MIRALLILGVAYRLRRSRRLLACWRLDELHRVQDAVDRDLERLRRTRPPRLARG